MFVRGGVYRVVKEAMGGILAKLSVSALLFDYVLTGPISAVSAGQYFGGFLLDMSVRRGHPCIGLAPRSNYLAAGFGVLVTVYFWWKNIQGIHESSDKALRIMQITTVMVGAAHRVVPGYTHPASTAPAALANAGEPEDGP